MQLTRRGLLLLLPAVIPLGLAALWRPAVFIAFAWLVIAAAILYADWRLSAQPSDWQLTRRHDDRLSLAALNRVDVEVARQGGARRGNGRPTTVTLRDEPPPSFGVQAQPIFTGKINPPEPLRLTYTVRPPRRGDYRFGDLYLRWDSPLRLLTRQARFPSATSVKVYPNLSGVQAYDLVVRKNRIWELGLRATRVLGAGNEFERLRDYQPDDEYRRINWKATARRGKPISAEFQTERSQNLVALLDVGRMMRSPVGDIDKLDYAINAVLLLAYVATGKGDRVGMLAFADRPLVWLAPRAGRGQFYRMLEALYAVQAQRVEPDYAAALSYFSVQQQKRSLAVLFTDLTGSVGMDALVAQMTRLRRTHLPLLVTVADPAVQELVEQPVRDSRSLYERTSAEQALDERALTVERLRANGVSTLDVPADELSVAVINRYLDLKARTQL